jgi:hypothetical protein
VEKGSRETDAGREDQLIPNGSRYHRTEANIYSIECRTGNRWLWWFGGAEKAYGRMGDWKEGRSVPHLLGGLQKLENEEKCSDVEKREGSSRSKS